MGTCMPLEDSFEYPHPFDDFYCVCRNLRYLIRVTDNGIHKLKYDNSIKIRKDSGVGYLNDGRIMVLGGTDNSGCLTNKAYILEPAKNKVTILPNLPISIKEGNLFHYKDFVYVIGALKDSDDEEILSQEQSAPIMRYYLKSGQWEIFNEEHLKKRNFQHMIRKSAKSFDSEGSKRVISYKDILYPGCFMIKSKVYLICGQQMSIRGILETLDQVYSLDLEEEEFDFKREEFQVPLKVFRPICGSYKNFAFVTGGVEHSGKCGSKKSYLFDFSTNPPTYEPIGGLKSDLDDNYPVITSPNYFYCLGYPNLAIFNVEDKTWKQFVIDQEFVNRRDIKYQTPVMSSIAIGGLQSIKNTVKLSFMDKKVKIVEDEMPSGESLSEVDASMNINLPPGLVIDGFKEDKTKEKHIRSSSSNSSASSGQFSAERIIEIPEALKMRDSDRSSISSISKPDVDSIRVNHEENPPIAPKKNKKNAKSGKKRESGESFSQSFSEEDSLYFVQAEGIPKLSDKSKSSISQSNSKDISYTDKSSSIDLERQIPVQQRPAKNAPIQNVRKSSNPSFSAKSSSSESFEEEEEEDESSSSDSRV